MIFDNFYFAPGDNVMIWERISENIKNFPNVKKYLWERISKYVKNFPKSENIC